MTTPYDNFVLNPAEFTPELPEVDLRKGGIQIGPDTPDLGETMVNVERIKRLIGEGVTAREMPTIECTIPLWGSTDQAISQAEAYQPLAAFVADVQQGRIRWIRRDFSDVGGFKGSLATFVDNASLPAPMGREISEFPLKLSRHPIWYATAEILAGEASGSEVRDLELELAELLGTAPGLIRLVITNEGAEDWRGCMVAIECDSFSSDETALPKYEAAKLTPKGGAVISATSAPELRAVGAVAAGTGAISPGLPAGTAVGDLLVMVAESGGATASTEANAALTAEGWEEAPNGTQKQGNTRLTILYRIATGTDPTITNDTGDHQLARIIGIKAGTFDPKSIFNTSAKGIQAATKSVSIPGLATTRDKCLIIACASGNLPDSTTTAEFSAAANPVLSSVIERIDNTTAEGDGGAIFAATGVLELAGPYSGFPTTATAVTEAERAVIAVAVNPIPVAVKCPNLTFGWQTVLSSEIVGVGHMTHVDPRLLVFRLNDTSSVLDDVQWKAEWRQNGQAAWVQTMEASTPIVKSSPVIGGYQLLNMGQGRPERPLAGESRFEWRLQARSLSGSGKQPLIRDFYPMTTEQWQRVQDTSDTPIDGEVQKIAGSAGDPGAEAGKTVAWSVKSVSESTASITGIATTHWLQFSQFKLGLPAGTVVRLLASLVWEYPANTTATLEAFMQFAVEGSLVGSAQKVILPPNPTGTYTQQIELGPAEIAALTIAKANANSTGVRAYLTNATSGATVAVKARTARLAAAYAEGGNLNRVCFAGRSLESSDTGTRRQHITDDISGELIPDGLDLQAPVPGQAAQPMRVMVVPSVGDFETRADSAPTKLTAKLWYRPGYLSAPEAA